MLTKKADTPAAVPPPGVSRRAGVTSPASVYGDGSNVISAALRTLASRFRQTGFHSTTACKSCFGTGLNEEPGELAELYSKSELPGMATGIGICTRCKGRGVMTADLRL